MSWEKVTEKNCLDEISKSLGFKVGSRARFRDTDKKIYFGKITAKHGHAGYHFVYFEADWDGEKYEDGSKNTKSWQIHAEYENPLEQLRIHGYTLMVGDRIYGIVNARVNI